MIQVSTLHHKSTEWVKIIRSHKLTPHDAVTIFCIIEGEKENIISILEDHLLEMISWVEWQVQDIDADFAYVAEHFNHFINNISTDELTGISVLLAVNSGSALTLSTIGHAQVLLVEKHGEISSISVEEPGKYEFHSISSGEIPPGGNVYLSNTRLESILWDDILFELGELDTATWITTGETILTREYAENIHIIRIENHELAPKRVRPDSGWQNSLVTKIWVIATFVREHFPLREWKTWIHKIPKENRTIQYGFLIVGIFILFSLIYSLVSGISTMIHTSSSDSKNQLLQAQTLIEQSQKLTSNPSAFNTNIKKAEEILFTLRDNKEHMTDTQELLWQIEAMKKEVNDVQTVDMSKYSSIIKFNPTDISPIGVLEKNKKLYLIGINGAIMDYTRDAPLPKVSSYPPGESAAWYDVEENGNFYILTKNSRVLAPRGNELTYVTVSGQDRWEDARTIKTFNGNLYLISQDARQIFKHKPGMNGFSPQAAVLPEGTSSGILDIGIDWGIYVLLQDGKILRYISGKTDIPKSMLINKVPGEYDIGQYSPTELFVRTNLTYVYILSGNRIWIFQPDAKRFQDIASLTYVAQLEIQTQEEIRSIYVPRDGTIDITTNLWVYEIGFEVADGKIILR